MKQLNRMIGMMSIKGKLLVALLIAMLPLLIVMLVVHTYLTNATRNQVALSNRNFINVYVGQIDQSLAEISRFLLNVVTKDQNLLYMERLEQADPDQYMLSKIRLFNTLASYGMDDALIDYFFVYSVRNRDLFFAPGNVAVTDDKERMDTTASLRSYILVQAEAEEYPYINWTMIHLRDHHYLFQMIQSGSNYIGALIDVKKLEAPFAQLDFARNGQALFVSGQGQAISDSAFIREAKHNRVDWSFREDGYILTGDHQDYFLVGSRSKQANIGLAVLQLDNEVLRQSQFLQWMVIVTIAGEIVVVLLLLILIRRTILVPVDSIIRAMRRLRAGNFDIRIAGYAASREFTMMHETFNNMAGEIQELKINIYEERLKHQSAELKQLQLQMNPHFFLNSLNIIYYLAQVGNFSLIQDMAISLIRYFRYMFRSNSDFVTLQEEITHTQNYLRIQELRFPENLAARVDAPDALMSCLIPPLTIQSFVENAIKHAQSLDHVLLIEIQASRLESENDDMLKLTIRDTGSGFTEEVLQVLQQNEDFSHDNGDRIGIWNIRRRLDLLYGGKASLQFRNADEPEQGAVVDILIPRKEYL